MNAICPSCHATLSCTCQQRRASDGTMHCVACIQTYEVQLNEKKNGTKSAEQSTVLAPTVHQITFKID